MLSDLKCLLGFLRFGSDPSTDPYGKTDLCSSTSRSTACWGTARVRMEFCVLGWAHHQFALDTVHLFCHRNRFCFGIQVSPEEGQKFPLSAGPWSAPDSTPPEAPRLSASMRYGPIFSWGRVFISRFSILGSLQPLLDSPISAAPPPPVPGSCSAGCGRRVLLWG